MIDADLDAEIARSKTQLKSGFFMSREATSNRCEQMAQHLLVHDRIMTVDEIVKKVNEVDSVSVKRIAKKMMQKVPTLTALGPVSNLESYEKLCNRLK
jgi:predicted Zn-dependent peptidase